MLIKDRNHDIKTKFANLKKVQYFIKVKFRWLLAVIWHCRARIDYKIRKHYSTCFGRYCLLSTNHRESIHFAINVQLIQCYCSFSLVLCQSTDLTRNLLTIIQKKEIADNITKLRVLTELRLRPGTHANTPRFNPCWRAWFARSDECD